MLLTPDDHEPVLRALLLGAVFAPWFVLFPLIYIAAISLVSTPLLQLPILSPLALFLILLSF